MTQKMLPHRRMKSSCRHIPAFNDGCRFAAAGERDGEWGFCRGISMVQLLAYGRSLRLVAMALCSVTLAVSASPASARPHHGRHARAYHAGHHARRHRHAARLSRLERGVAQMQAEGFIDANAVPNTGGVIAEGSVASSGLVSEARRYLGGNPTGRSSLWCARFMNLVLQHSGYRGTGSDMANS